MKLGVIAIARPTFDVSFAQATANTAWDTLSGSGHEIVGSPEVAMTIDQVADRRDQIDGVDAVVILQASFADSSLVVHATDVDLPTALWAFPEDRTGGRLRLNSFCGINLAGYTLTSLGRRYSWVYTHADDATVPSRIASHLADAPMTDVSEFGSSPIDEAARVAASGVVERLRATTIGRVGERPDGFEPCGYESGALFAMFGVTVDEVPLPELFGRAAGAGETDVVEIRGIAQDVLSGIDDVDQVALDKSLRLNVGLRSLISERGWAGVATRCWPETFTEFGGAACTPMALLNIDGTPGVCEADVYGNITALILQWLGDAEPFVADLVHLDHDSNTGVLWHCGLAPFTMADPDAVARATIHSNRSKPLLSEFPLKPGRVSIARLSTSKGQHRLVVGGGEMIKAPLAFSGTAGVVRFDRSVTDVLDTVLGEGLEHHFGIVYGDVRDELRAFADIVDIAVVEL